MKQVKLKDLVKLATEKGLTGLEWTAGIPGTIGGAIRGNAAAFGHSISEIIQKVEVLNDNLRSLIFNFENCQFNYKSSIFKRNSNLIIVSAEIKLEKGDEREIRKKIKENLEYRQKNHPLEFGSAGCIFQNKISNLKSQKLLKKYSKINQFSKDNIIPAGWLIEQCGLKGKRIGNAQISEKHSNFIVNLGNAKAKDVLDLIKLIKNKVKSKFKINLQEEIQFVNCN